MISYLLVVEQHRTQIVIHALLKCQQENLYQDRKSGSAGMPRPISYAVFCLKKKKTRADYVAPPLILSAERHSDKEVTWSPTRYTNGQAGWTVHSLQGKPTPPL